jgi:hypothetical protein
LTGDIKLEKTNVLIFPAGSENAIEVYESLYQHIDIEVFGASGKSDHAAYLYPKDRYSEDNYYIEDPGFIQRFNQLIDRWKIDIVIPTHDTIAQFLANNREKINAKILTADAKTADICRQKRKTFDLFSDCDFCPKTYPNLGSVSSVDYPLFLKPNIGEGGKRTKLLLTQAEALYLSQEEDLIICEYLPGEEYTVDCYTNRNGDLLFCGLRQRDRIHMGIAMRSHTLDTSEDVLRIAQEINSRIKMFGAWFFQLKEDRSGKLKLLEVSCRHAGTMTLFRHKGVNFALMGIYELNGIDVAPLEMPGSWSLDRCLRARFKLPFDFDTVYVDLDDTLIVKGMVNPVLTQFLYQCVNENKKIVLLTKHDTSPKDTLNKFKINPDLFDQIIHLSIDQSKAACITQTRSILIDNSFAERKSVYDTHGIPVFDVDAVDCLIQ